MTSAPIRRVVLQDLAAFTHLVTRFKVVPDPADQGALPRNRSAKARRAFRRRAAAARAGAGVADAAQGHRGGLGIEPAARRRRHGADPHRPCGRPADAGRGAAALEERCRIGRYGVPRAVLAACARRIAGWIDGAGLTTNGFRAVVGGQSVAGAPERRAFADRRDEPPRRSPQPSPARPRPSRRSASSVSRTSSPMSG